MRIAMTALVAALALTGGVAHAASPRVGEANSNPYQGVYLQSGRSLWTIGSRAAGSDLPGRLVLPTHAHFDEAGSLLAAGGGSDDAGQTMLADGGGSDDTGQTMLADGGPADLA